MRAVDTNVLVRLIARDDAGQTASAERFIEKGAWVSVLALVETAWVLATVYELSPGALAGAVEMLLNHRNLVFQDPETVADALELVPCAAGTRIFRLSDTEFGEDSGTSSTGHLRSKAVKGRGHAKALAGLTV